jgi:hypothetical protein
MSASSSYRFLLFPCLSDRINVLAISICLEMRVTIYERHRETKLPKLDASSIGKRFLIDRGEM